MKLKITFLLILYFCFYNLKAQSYYPGGVPGAEVWYSANYQHITSSIFENWGNPDIKIEPCTADLSPTLFNYNYSFGTGGLCLRYKAPLERNTARNIFFVGEPKDISRNLSHLTTELTQVIVAPNTTTVTRFDFSTKTIFNNDLILSYDSTTPVKEVINFYNWNNYQVDRKTQTYGLQGETTFSIGKNFSTPAISAPKENSEIATIPVETFAGNFPEYISFPYELSTNQKERVESYLALKYGITLHQGKSYINSKNTIFWNVNNNGKFKNNIFGLGRDKTSNLNQLQSQSVHRKEYLTAAIGSITDNNFMKQQSIDIKDNNFIVFGDNGKAEILSTANSFGVRRLERKWLSQNTGDESSTYPVHFNFKIPPAITNAILANPTLKIWMIHDKYATNNQESEFSSQYVEHYQTAGIQNGYAYFKEIFFDPDKSTYDQYTFGVGPEMIVQVRFDDDCNDKSVKSNIVITGSRPPYRINITNTNGYNGNFDTNENIFAFEATAPDTYTIDVQDSYGNAVQTIVDVALPNISLDLDPEYILSSTQTSVTINAGLNVNDPGATYQWFYNSSPLDFTGPALITSDVGKYTVIITSGNRLCTFTDETIVRYRFKETVSLSYNCNEPSTGINIILNGGIPPFTTTIYSNGQTFDTHVYNTENFLAEGIPAGQYVITTIDSIGSGWSEPILVKAPLEGIELDLLSQLQLICNNIDYNSSYNFPIIACGNTFTLDASLLVTNPYASYEWFVNGVSLNIYTAVAEFYQDINQPPGGIKEFMVKITNDESGCFITQSFGMKSIWTAGESSVQITDTETIQESSKEEDTDDHGEYALKTKIYPNPSDHNATFYYEISATEPFSGTVQIFTPTGALIKEQKIEGQAGYTIPFYLLTSGTYFVRTTTTTGKIVSDKIVIK